MSSGGKWRLFQSTLPGWGATRRLADIDKAYDVFQSTLPGWGATGMTMAEIMPYFNISIHAPRMGSDLLGVQRGSGYDDFNPRSPDGERPSTPPSYMRSTHFNPRSPDGERRGGCRKVALLRVFQSTLPGWGATRSSTPSVIPPSHFNPRSPDGERLVWTPLTGAECDISIHAPRMGSYGGYPV